MFEYLMPLLVMRSYAGTLLDETYEAVVRARSTTRRGAACRGASPSRPTTRRISKANYQYQAFGVPGLGLKRGLADDLVVAPYATLLAAPLAPARKSLREPRAARARKGSTGATATTRRSTTRPSGCRRDAKRRRRPRDLHGAPPGDEPARARQPAQRRADAAPLPCRSARAGGRAAAPGAHPAPGAAEESADRTRRARADDPRRGGAGGAALRDAAHAQPARAPAVERILFGDGDQCRRRLQPPAEPRHDALARGHHHRRVGQLLLRPRSRNGRGLVHDPPAGGARRRRVRSDVRPRSRRLPPAWTDGSKPAPKSWCPPKTTSSCGACRSPTTAPRPATSSSPATPRWCSRPRMPTSRIPRSAICSSRPRRCPSATR